MRQNGLSNNDATKILKRAKEFGITFDKMDIGESGYFASYLHFDSKDFIRKQEHRVNTIRVDFKKINIDIINIVKGLENEK